MTEWFNLHLSWQRSDLKTNTKVNLTIMSCVGNPFSFNGFTYQSVESKVSFLPISYLQRYISLNHKMTPTEQTNQTSTKHIELQGTTTNYKEVIYVYQTCWSSFSLCFSSSVLAIFTKSRAPFTLNPCRSLMASVQALVLSMVTNLQ